MFTLYRGGNISTLMVPTFAAYYELWLFQNIAENLEGELLALVQYSELGDGPGVRFTAESVPSHSERILQGRQCVVSSLTELPNKAISVHT